VDNLVTTHSTFSAASSVEVVTLAAASDEAQMPRFGCMWR